MWEYLIGFAHKICCALSFDPEVLKLYIEIALSILSGVVMLIGLNYIKPLKEKTVTATFTFWSQIKVKLTRLKTQIENDNSLIENIFSPELRPSTENLSVTREELSEFKKSILAILDFMEKSSDQMPAYIGWSDDYTKLIDYLNDIVVYNVCDSNNNFKYDRNSQKVIPFDQYCNDFCSTIQDICTGINYKQKKIEKRILSKKTINP